MFLLYAVQVVTDSSWENLVISSENPVLVEFWAPWCGPCRMIAPAIEELAKEYAGKVACFKLNTDDSPNIATKYGIRSIPTVLFFKNGEKKESIIGAVPKSTLSSTLDKYVEWMAKNHIYMLYEWHINPSLCFISNVEISFLQCVNIVMRLKFSWKCMTLFVIWMKCFSFSFPSCWCFCIN